MYAFSQHFTQVRLCLPNNMYIYKTLGVRLQKFDYHYYHRYEITLLIMKDTNSIVVVATLERIQRKEEVYIFYYSFVPAYIGLTN